MSITSLRRLALLVDAVSVVLVSFACGRWASHRAEMAEPWRQPSCHPSVISVKEIASPIGHVGAPLGRFGVPERANPVEPEAAAPTLRQLGRIAGAILPPPDAVDAQPAILIDLEEPQDGVRRIALRIGEAVVNDPHPELGRMVPQPRRYRFIGFERDAADPDVIWFSFDLCPDKERRVAWRPRQVRPLASPGAMTPGPRTVVTPRALVGHPPKTSPSVRSRPVPVPLFRQEKGVWRATVEGAAELERTGEELARDVGTREVRGPLGRPGGLRIVGIRAGSRAHEFGLRADDVLISVNGREIRGRAALIGILRSEARHAARLTVRLRRSGREMERVYQVRKP